ncbi:MAG: molecular chaperone TorD family protein [Nitrospirota bacterium]
MNPYRLFSLVFSYPTEKTVAAVSEAVDDEAALLTACVQQMQCTPLEQLQEEYTRLFINSYPTLLCPPYESFYRDGTLYGSSSAEVKEIYKTYGLDYTYEGEPPDLLSVELDFLALTNDGAFLERLNGWIFAFTKRVKEHSGIYGPCAEELEEFLRAAVAR